MAKEIYEIPYNEQISVLPAGYNVYAMNNSFEYRVVAWFSDECEAKKFAQSLCDNERCRK